MITKEAKSEIRNYIVKANLALHSSDIRGLREMLGSAVSRVNALKLGDLERGSALSMLDGGSDGD